MSRRAFAASEAEWAYHDGQFVKMGDIRLSPATHALNYGTGVFEGIRAYWSPTRGTMQVLKMREHYERFEKSCRFLRIELPHTIEELCDITLEILRRNAPREDTYIRPLAYKSATSVGVELEMPVVAERDVDRTELYAADEVFLTGTGFQIAPVIEVDGRPVGNREIGPVSGRLQELYFKAGRRANY